MIYILALPFFLWVFWAVYVLVMGIYRAHLAGKIKGVTLVLSLPWVLIGYAMDVMAQYTLACLFFLDWPKRGEHLVTDRLKRYIKQGIGWRARKADWICSNLLDVFDPSGNHC